MVGLDIRRMIGDPFVGREIAMKRIILSIAALCTLAIGPAALDPCAANAQSGCCKICKAGKACGDTCIAADKVCHKGPGCACDG